PEASVHTIKSAFRCGVRHLAYKCLGQTLEVLMASERPLGRSFFAGRLFENESFFGINESQIDIGVVVEFLPAELSKSEHCEFGGKPSRARALMVRPSKS